MIRIPAQIQTRYEALLVKKAIPERHHLYYRKWLRYYLDFCHKYDLKKSNKESLSHFSVRIPDLCQPILKVFGFSTVRF